MTSSGPSPRKIKKVVEDPTAGSDDDEHGDGMDEATRQVSDIEECQKELDQLNKKCYLEQVQVKNKYNKLRKPCYGKRAAVIDKIPNFWVKAILNHPQIAMLVDQEEKGCLYFLKKLEVEDFEDCEDGFRIKFVFDDNPYFDNQELVKEFIFERYAIGKGTSTGIQWKEQMDISKKQSQKRGRKKFTFFSWFSNNNPLAARRVVNAIKDDMWPNPLQYYMNLRRPGSLRQK